MCYVLDFNVCGLRVWNQIYVELMCCSLDFNVWGLCESNQIYLCEFCVMLIPIYHYCSMIYAN
jgi:hypothetical protein